MSGVPFIVNVHLSAIASIVLWTLACSRSLAPPPGDPVSKPEEALRIAFEKAVDWESAPSPNRQSDLYFYSFQSPLMGWPGPSAIFIDRGWKLVREKQEGYYGWDFVASEGSYKLPTTGYYHEPPAEAWPPKWASLERQRKDVIRLVLRARAEIAAENLGGAEQSRLGLDSIVVAYEETPSTIEIQFEDVTGRKTNQCGEVEKTLYSRTWLLHDVIINR